MKKTKEKNPSKEIVQNKETQALIKKYREDSKSLFQDLNPPVLANASDIIYKAFKRPYEGPGADVLVILADGWYYPTPEVKLYFESVADGEFKLMQQNSTVGFYLKTFHSAQWTSGAGLINLGDTIIVEDAFGKHSVKVESF